MAALSGYKRQQKEEHGQFNWGLKACSSCRGKHKTRKEHCKAWKKTAKGFERACFKCGGVGHVQADCKVRKEEPSVNTVQMAVK